MSITSKQRRERKKKAKAKAANIKRMEKQRLDKFFNELFRMKTGDHDQMPYKMIGKD